MDEDGELAGSRRGDKSREGREKRTEEELARAFGAGMGECVVRTETLPWPCLGCAS